MTQHLIPSSRLRRAGLSLIEVMISLAIASMLLVAVGTAFNASAAAIENNDQFVSASRAARVAMTQLLAEIRRCQALQVSGSQLALFTFNNENRTYSFDSTSKQLQLGITGNATVYPLANNVTSASFTADSAPDPQTHVMRVVRVSVAITVQVGQSTVTLCGSAAPRCYLAY